MYQEPSKHQNEIHSNSRTGKITIINNVTTLVVAESRSDGLVMRNESTRTSQYVGFDRQSHDFDQGMITPGTIIRIPSSF